MLIWMCWRQRAIYRHAFWNAVFEDGDDEAWKRHKKMIRAVYGW